MARRSDIDWQAVERDYRGGKLTSRALSDLHGVSDSTIRARAKKEGWTQDLSAQIEARAKAKIAAIDVAELIEQSAQESAQESAQTLKNAIEHAADIAAGVAMRHRGYIKSNLDRAERIEKLLDDMLPAAAEIRDVATLAGAFKSLTESRNKWIDQERKSFGLDSEDSDDDYETGLKKLHGGT